MMRLVASITVWKRHELARIVIEHWARVILEVEAAGIDLTLIVVGSEGEQSKALCEGMDAVIYVEHENQPLGSKVNAGIKRALEIEDVAGVVLFGSDEFANADLILSYAELLGDDVDYIGVTDRFVWKIAPEEGLWHFTGYPENHPRFGEPHGGARCLSARLLREWGGEAYDAVESGLDATLTRRLRGVSATTRICRLGDLPRSESVYLDIRTCCGFSRPPHDFPSRYEPIEQDVLSGLFDLQEIAFIQLLRDSLETSIDALILVRGDRGTELKRALSSLNGQGVSNVIVRVDTRFSSYARRVADEAGCDIIMSNEVPKYGDEGHSIHFSKARNEMLEYATSEFVFWLDADEVLTSRAPTLLEEATRAKALGLDAVKFTLNAVHQDGRSDTGPQIRIHRREGIHFTLPVHNVMVGAEKVGGCGAVVCAYYADDKDRDARTPPMLVKLMEEGDPDCELPREAQEEHAIYHLCLDAFARGDYEECWRWGQLCRDRFHSSKSRADFWVCLVYATARCRPLMHALEVLEEAKVRHPYFPDLLWLSAAFDTYKAVVYRRKGLYPNTRSGADSQFAHAQAILDTMGIPLNLGGQ